MNHLKFLCLLVLLPIFVKAQHLEFSLKQYNYFGQYGTADYKSIDFVASERINSFAIGLRARYILDTDIFFDGEVSSVFGQGSLEQKDEGSFSSIVELKLRSSGVVSLAIGKLIEVDKLRLTPYFKFGGSYTESGVTNHLKSYYEGVIQEELRIISPSVVSAVLGPGIGMDYQVLKAFYFGIDLSYLMYIGGVKDSSTQEFKYYNENGTLIDETINKVELDKTFINLNRIGISWTLTYRLY